MRLGLTLILSFWGSVTWCGTWFIYSWLVGSFGFYGFRGLQLQSTDQCCSNQGKANGFSLKRLNENFKKLCLVKWSDQKYYNLYAFLTVVSSRTWLITQAYIHLLWSFLLPLSLRRHEDLTLYSSFFLFKMNCIVLSSSMCIGK